MEKDNEKWIMAKDELMSAIDFLGFPKELGIAIVKNLGSPKAIHRMAVYLMNEKPDKIEIVVDEMLSICTEIAAWRNKKESEKANTVYNELLNNGLVTKSDI